MGLPSHVLTSRSSSIHESATGTLASPMLLSFMHTSVGVENVMPRLRAHSGRARRNSRMPLESEMPMADRFMKILTSCSSSGSLAILSI